jgi:hypothetical protein
MAKPLAFNHDGLGLRWEPIRSFAGGGLPMACYLLVACCTSAAAAAAAGGGDGGVVGGGGGGGGGAAAAAGVSAWRALALRLQPAAPLM